MTDGSLRNDGWAPAACTLPAVEQPLRLAQLDALLVEDVTRVEQVAEGRVRFELRPEPSVAARAAGLAVRETGCCSFFAFDIAIGAGTVSMTVSADESHASVLDTLLARARARLGNRA